MTERVRYRPFTGDETLRVRLDAAPLELVLCQVRWPEFGFLQGDISSFATALGDVLTEYPIYSSNAELAFAITPQGVQQSQVGTIYQWKSLDGAWSVSFGRRFLAISSTKYTTYDEFNERLRDVVSRAQPVLGVQIIERVGVRYINRIADLDVVARLDELVRPEVLGYQALPLSGAEVNLVQGINQALFTVGDSMLQVRSGVIPAGETVDAAVTPLQSPSWVLDFDSFVDAAAPFDVGAIVARASRLSDAAYDFFKFVVKQGFIEQFGGVHEQTDS